MAAPESVPLLISDGSGMWQMKQDIAEKIKQAKYARKWHNNVMLKVGVTSAEMEKATMAALNSQMALTESRTYWALAAIAERDMWIKSDVGYAPTFWQIYQEAQGQLAHGVAEADIWDSTTYMLNTASRSSHNKGPGLCRSKPPLASALPSGKYLITHRCKSKGGGFIRDLHLELKSTIESLKLENGSHVSAIIGALAARYKKHLDKQVQLQKKRLATKEGKVGAVAEAMVAENPGIQSLREVVAILEAAHQGVHNAKITGGFTIESEPAGKFSQHMGRKVKFPDPLMQEKTSLHLNHTHGLRYNDKWDACEFSLESSCMERNPPQTPFKENDMTTEFFNKKISPKLAPLVNIVIKIANGSTYEITVQPFHGMSTSVVCPFLAKPREDSGPEVDFRKKDYDVYQLEQYAIQGLAEFYEAMGHTMRTMQCKEVHELLKPLSDETCNRLLLHTRVQNTLFPKNRVYYSEANKDSGTGSVLFVHFEDQIVGVRVLSPSILHLWTDNVNPVIPPPPVAFRGRPRAAKKLNQTTASMFSEVALVLDPNLKGKVPTNISMQNVLSREGPRFVNFVLADAQTLTYNTPGDIPVKLELKPVKYEHSTTGTRVVWEMFILNLDGTRQMIGYKTPKDKSPVHVLFTKTHNWWKFEKDLAGNPLASKDPLDLTVIQSGGNYTDTPSKITVGSSNAPAVDPEGILFSPSSPREPPPLPKQPRYDGSSSQASSRPTTPARERRETPDREDNHGGRTVSVPTPSGFVFTAPVLKKAGGLYTRDYMLQHDLEENRIPKTLRINAVPTTGKRMWFSFTLVDAKNLYYESFERDSVTLELRLRRPVAGANESIAWELSVKTDRGPVFIGKKEGINCYKLFETQQSNWRFTKDVKLKELNPNAVFDPELTITNPQMYETGSTDLIFPDLRSEGALLPLQPRRLSSRPAPAPWASPAVDMESLMASIDDIKRALNEVHLSARPRVPND
jgi:hypothetical protein